MWQSRHYNPKSCWRVNLHWHCFLIIDIKFHCLFFRSQWSPSFHAYSGSFSGRHTNLLQLFHCFFEKHFKCLHMNLWHRSPHSIPNTSYPYQSILVTLNIHQSAKTPLGIKYYPSTIIFCSIFQYKYCKSNDHNHLNTYSPFQHNKYYTVLTHLQPQTVWQVHFFFYMPDT